MAPDNGLFSKLRSSWNLFINGESRQNTMYQNIGAGYGYRYDRTRLILGNEQSLVNAVYNRIGIDVSAIGMQHVRVDENGRFLEPITSALNSCLTTAANIDQTGRAFIQDIVMSLCDEGSVAIVPIDVTGDPLYGTYDILSMRTGRIIQWYPKHVKVNLYNENTGLKQDLILEKSYVAVVENPLYSVMNEPNSTLKRLVDKINLLDVIDKQSGSGKLDIIIQLPYTLKSETRREQAERRRETIETQLKDSQYGIAYVDSTEKITQLNRPAENNLMGQIEYLTSMLWNQLGLTKEVFDGTADEIAMSNYYNRTIEPFLAAITDAMKRTFLTKTARTQGQSIMAIRDPFRLVQPSQLADLADKLTRNEIVTSNEFRGVIGMRPSKDPGADELRNKNLNQKAETTEQKVEVVTSEAKLKKNQNGRNKE